MWLCKKPISQANIVLKKFHLGQYILFYTILEESVKATKHRVRLNTHVCEDCQ